MNRGANSLSVTKQQVRKRYNLCSLQFFSFAFVWHFRNFSVVGDKKKFLKKFSQNFGKIALCGVVGIERKSSGFGKLPNKQKSPAVGRQKTDDFTERVPLSYACSETYHFNKHRKDGKGMERKRKIKDGHIVVKNPLYQEMPKQEVAIKSGKTLYRFTGSYDGERSLPHKVLRLMGQEKAKKDVEE